jgi:hypothetical protein
LVTLWDKQGWIFCNAVGHPIEVTNMIKRSFRPLLVKAGVPSITFHSLQHSTASLLLSLGIHHKIVQELLGHSQITLALDIYSHVLPSMQREVLDRLSAVLTTAGDPVDVNFKVFTPFEQPGAHQQSYIIPCCLLSPVRKCKQSTWDRKR